MPIKLVSPLIHIEVVVRDAEEAYQFLHKCFGSEKVQKEMAQCATEAWKDGKQQKVIHVDLGGTVIQFIEPHKESIYTEFLEKKGPGVHNLTFLVNDVKGAAKIMEKEGAPVLVDIAPNWNYKKNEEITGRPAEKFDAMIMGGEDKVGFRFELITPSESLKELS